MKLQNDFWISGHCILDFSKLNLLKYETYMYDQLILCYSIKADDPYKI